MGDARHFRILIWQKVLPLLGLVVPAFFLASSPTGKSLPLGGWIALAAIVGVAAAWWIWRAWQRSDVVLDDDGLTCWVGGVSLETWPYDRLLNIKRYGKYRARMCFDPDIADTHMHITLDLVRADAFVAALLAEYELSTGRELDLRDAA